MVQIPTSSILHPLYTNKRESRLKKHYSYWHVGREQRMAETMDCCMFTSETRQVEGHQQLPFYQNIRKPLGKVGLLCPLMVLFPGKKSSLGPWMVQESERTLQIVSICFINHVRSMPLGHPSPKHIQLSSCRKGLGAGQKLACVRTGTQARVT